MTRPFAAGVPSQAAAGQCFMATRPLLRSRPARGWSLGYPPRHRLQGVGAMDVDPGLTEAAGQRLQGRPRPLVGYRVPVPLQLVRGQVVHAGPGHEAVCGQMYVPGADGRGDVGLVGRLVGAETDITIGPEDPPVPELLRQVVQQGRHRRVGGPLVDHFVLGPVEPGVVHLKSLVELQGFGRPPLERHGRECTQIPCGWLRVGPGEAGPLTQRAWNMTTCHTLTLHTRPLTRATTGPGAGARAGSCIGDVGVISATARTGAP